MIWPVRDGMTPISDFISVDLPMPLRPTSATISPCATDEIDAVQDLALAIGGRQIANIEHRIDLIRFSMTLPKTDRLL